MSSNEFNNLNGDTEAILSAGEMSASRAHADLLELQRRSAALSPEQQRTIDLAVVQSVMERHDGTADPRDVEISNLRANLAAAQAVIREQAAALRTLVRTT